MKVPLYEYNFMLSIKCFYGEHLLKEPCIVLIKLCSGF